MKIGLPWIDQIRSRSDHALGFTAQTFEETIAQIVAAYHKEHTVDDGHATIHASGSIAERARTTPMGVWLTAPYSASYFSATTGSTWTPTQGQTVALQYMLVGSSMTVSWYIESSTIGTAAPAVLYITIPGNYKAIRRVSNTFSYDDNGTKGIGIVQVRPPSALLNSGFAIELSKDVRGSATFSVSAAMTVLGQITFEIYQSDTTAQASTSFIASGGTITQAGGKTIHTFTASGNFVVAQGAAAIDYLIVGGGGGGAVSSGGGGGGGGGKVTVLSAVPVAEGTLAVVIGPGGPGGTSLGAAGSAGTASSFNGTTAAAGLGGGSAGGPGGTSGSGKTGANADAGSDGGGGGGDSANGAIGNGVDTGGAGGAGTANALSGASVTYGGGGGGHGTSTGGAGTAGGGNGAYDGVTPPQNGTANRGGGGGGTGTAGYNGGAGGSGIVIISYTTP